MASEYKKQTSREYPSDVLQHRGIYCSSRERIRWCKKYLSRVCRRRSNREVTNMMTQDELDVFVNELLEQSDE